MAAIASTTLRIQFYDVFPLEPEMAYWMNHAGYWAEIVTCKCFEHPVEHQGDQDQVLEYVWHEDDPAVFKHTTRSSCYWDVNKP